MRAHPAEGTRALVTGASGKTGRAVTAALVARGVRVRAAIRPGSPHESVCRAAGADEVDGVDLVSGAGLDAAVAAVDAIYHLAPNVHPDELAMAEQVARAAARAGVGRLAFHSVLHPDDQSMPHHRRKGLAERAVRRTLPRATIVRPAAYLDNLVPAALSGELVVPYSLDTPFSSVALADVAECAAEILAHDRHAGQTYDLTGPEVLSVRQMAESASAVLHRPVVARRVGIDEWAAGPGAGLAAPERDDLMAMFESYDAVGLAEESEDLSRLLGHRGTTWAQALQDAADRLLRSGGR